MADSAPRKPQNSAIPAEQLDLDQVDPIEPAGRPENPETFAGPRHQETPDRPIDEVSAQLRGISTRQNIANPLKSQAFPGCALGGSKLEPLGTLSGTSIYLI